MKLANINSKKPYYVTKEGLIFNSDFNLVVGSIYKKYHLKIFDYKDIDGVTRRTTFTKVIFSTFYPEIPLEGCTIVRIGDKDDYSLPNLKCINNKKMTKIEIQNSEIKYLIVNEKGRVIETGEEFDTFQDTKVDLKSIEVGKRLRITFNNKVWTELNYKITEITEYA